MNGDNEFEFICIVNLLDWDKGKVYLMSIGAVVSIVLTKGGGIWVALIVLLYFTAATAAIMIPEITIIALLSRVDDLISTNR
jgi:hypothetical protein